MFNNTQKPLVILLVLVAGTCSYALGEYFTKKQHNIINPNIIIEDH